MIKRFRRWVRRRGTESRIENARRALDVTVRTLENLQMRLHEYPPLATYSAEDLAEAHAEMDRVNASVGRLQDGVRRCFMAWQDWRSQSGAAPCLVEEVSRRMKEAGLAEKVQRWGPENPQPASPYSENPNDKPVTHVVDEFDGVREILKEADAQHDETPPPLKDVQGGVLIEEPQPTADPEPASKRPARRVAPRRQPQTRRPSASGD